MQSQESIPPRHTPRSGAASSPVVDHDRQPAHGGARMVAGAGHEHGGRGAHRQLLREAEVERDIEPVGCALHAMFSVSAGIPADVA
jgi:hypothetical protein